MATLVASAAMISVVVQLQVGRDASPGDDVSSEAADHSGRVRPVATPTPTPSDPGSTSPDLAVETRDGRPELVDPAMGRRVGPYVRRSDRAYAFEGRNRGKRVFLIVRSLGHGHWGHFYADDTLPPSLELETWMRREGWTPAGDQS